MSSVIEGKFGDPVRRVISADSYIASERGFCVMCLEDILPGQHCTRKIFVWENCRFPEAEGEVEWTYHDVCMDSGFREMLRQEDECAKAGMSHGSGAVVLRFKPMSA